MDDTSSNAGDNNTSNNSSIRKVMTEPEGGREESVQVPASPKSSILSSSTPSSSITGHHASHADTTMMEIFESSSIRSDSVVGQHNNSSSHVIGEKVQTLASQIYTQLQKILSRIPDDEEDEDDQSVVNTTDDATAAVEAGVEASSSVNLLPPKPQRQQQRQKNSDCVSDLMPLIVSVLESLDVSLIENQQLQVELELCRDDNEQLVTAFEKEKSAKKRVEQKLLELEFSSEEEKQQLMQQMESIENVVRVLELRAKNSSDHTMRLEEKENELKNEYSKLHVRYTELLRSHCDLMERVKILIGSESPSPAGSGGCGSNSESVVAHLLRNFLSRKQDVERDLESEMMSSSGQQQQRSVNRPNSSNLNYGPTSGRWDHAVDQEMSLDDPPSLLMEDHNNGGPQVEDLPHDNPQSLSQFRQPLSLITTTTSTGAATDSNFFGMEKEVENLISENNELLATKNALNIVKDDLIAKVDSLESEVTMARDERDQLTAVKNKLKHRISELEEEGKRLREQLDESRATLEKMRMDDEEGIPAVQRKRFTRLEMARVLMERNQYKEKLIELQEAVRWTELIRATRASGSGSGAAAGDEKRSAIWKFGKNLTSFSNLFAGSGSPAAASGSSSPPPTTTSMSRQGSTSTDYPSLVAPGLRFANNSVSPSTTATPALDAMRRRARAQQSSTHGPDLGLLMDPDLTIERTRALHRQQKQNRMRSQSTHAVVSRASASGVTANDGRIHAYGWSIPTTGSTSDQQQLGHQTSVPVPTYCRPLMCDDDSSGGGGGQQDIMGMKIWCACAVDLSGGGSGGNDGDGGLSGGPEESDGEGIRRQRIKDDDLKKEKENCRSRSSSSSSSRRKKSNELQQQQQIPDDDDSGIRALESELQEAMDESRRELMTPTEKTLSTFVWLCSVSASRSRVTVINIRSNPSEVLDSFLVRTHLLCIASIPGAKDSDFDPPVDLVEGMGDELPVGVTRSVVAGEIRTGVIGRRTDVPVVVTDECREASETTTTPTTAAAGEEREQQPVVMDKLSNFLAYSQSSSTASTEVNASSINNNNNSSSSSSLPLPSSPVYQPMSSTLPIIWLGGQNNQLYVHSSVAQWSHCIACFKLPDSVLHVTHVRGRVFVALANGTVCVFGRKSRQEPEFDFRNYLTVDIGLILATTIERTPVVTPVTTSNTSTSTSMSVTCSIRCVEIAKGNLVWLGYRNLVFILDPKTLKVVSSFPVHPRKESQVRQLSALGDGVWCSLRLDSTLRLYSAIRPFVHLQDIDVEPQVGKILSPKSAFSFIRITALKASGSRLWIGTANGVILSIPFLQEAKDEDNKTTSDPKISSRRKSSTLSQQSSLVTPIIVSTSSSSSRNNNNQGMEEERLSVSTFVPMCDANQSQLSFHGHRDAVKFFVCTKNLITSGGDGYIDFRVDEEDPQVMMGGGHSTHAGGGKTTTTTLKSCDRSHLIVWELMQHQVNSNNNSSAAGGRRRGSSHAANMRVRENNSNRRRDDV